MGIRVTPIDNQPRLMEYHGIHIWVRYQNSAMAIRNKRLIVVSEMGLSEAEYEAASEKIRDQAFGRAFVGTIVTHIEPFTVTDFVAGDDGEEIESVVEFEFDKPSSMPEYETMGEELLGEDSILRDEVMTFSVSLEHYRQKREATAMGNSKAPSASGG